MTSKGIAETTMEDIAAAVDYTRRTLYAYFTSRDEIYLMVLVEDMRKRWAVQQVALDAVATGLDKVVAWGESFYRFARSNPQSMRLHVYWDYRGIDRARISGAVFEAFERINTDLAQGLRAIFRLGVDDGSLRPDLRIDMCISQYVYSIRSVVYRALLPTFTFAGFEPDDYVAHFLDMFERSIRSHGGSVE